MTNTKQKQNTGEQKELDGNIERLRCEFLDYWEKHYSKPDTQILGEDLPMVPAFVFAGKNDLAKKILEQVTDPIRYDPERVCIYHRRSEHGEYFAGRFVGIEDQSNLVRALVSVGENEKATKAMGTLDKFLSILEYSKVTDKDSEELKERGKRNIKSAIELLIKRGLILKERLVYDLEAYLTILSQNKDIHEILDELKNQGGVAIKYRSEDDIMNSLCSLGKAGCCVNIRGDQLNIHATNPKKLEDLFVMPYVDSKTGKGLKCDNGMFDDYRNAPYLSRYLSAKSAVGDNELVALALKSIEQKPLPLNTRTAAKYLILAKKANVAEGKAVEESERLLKESFQQKNGLYEEYEKSNIFDLDTQLNVAHLEIVRGDFGKARELICRSKSQGIFKAEQLNDFYEDGTEVGALGLFVLEALHSPEKLKLVSYFS